MAYTDWHETEEKDAKGKWVNYDYDWMFKPGAMAEVVKYADGVGPGWYMLVDKEKSKPGNIVYTPLVKNSHNTKWNYIHTPCVKMRYLNSSLT